MQTQKSLNNPHIRIRTGGCKFHHYQPIPHFKILLDIHFHWNRTIDKMTTIANQRFISIRNIIIYLEIKFLPNRRIFVFWRPFWIQNGRHSKPTMDVNSQHHNLHGNQSSSKSEDFFILIQNGRHSKPKWSPYGAACLTSCIYPFPLKSFHFWILNDFLNFYIGGHFENSKTWMHLFEMGIHLPVKFSKDRIISLWEFGRTNRSEKRRRKNNNNNNNN